MKRDARSTTEALTRAVDALPGVHTAILYGSILDSRFGEHSDVDLAVAGDAELTYDELVEMSENLGRLVGEYEDIDWEIVFSIATRHLSDFESFVGAVRGQFE